MSADTDTAMFSMPTPPDNEDDFWLREADGSLVDVGPAYPPSDGAAQNPSGAGQGSAHTADFSTFLYYGETAAQRWPFDATLKNDQSLYEYSGTGNTQPMLVGVSGGEGSTDLISVCGTTLGSTTRTVGALSSDGSTAFFTADQCTSGSGANAATPVPANELFARIDQDRTVAISEPSAADCSACSTSSPQAASFLGASSDGSIAFFETTQALLGSDTTENLYEYDFDAPAGQRVTQVSATDDPAGARLQGVVQVSADGSHVYYVANGVIPSTPNAQGQSAVGGGDNLYVYDTTTGQTAFIATLASTDSQQWGSLNTNNDPNVTPTGQFLVFTSSNDLTPDDTSTNGFAQVFRYDAATGVLNRVSIGENGYNDDGNDGAGSAGLAQTNLDVASGLRRDISMSDDGTRVFFDSPVGLTPTALDDVPSLRPSTLAENIYEWEQPGIGSCPASETTGCVFLISDGQDTFLTQETTPTLKGTDPSGDNVFFTSTDQLAPQDSDGGQLNVWDARVDGGFPYTPPAPNCDTSTDDSCQGAPSAPPAAPAVATVSFAGPRDETSTATPKLKVARKTVKGDVITLNVEVPAKGAVTVTGKDVKRATKLPGRAGTYKLTLRLSEQAHKALDRRHNLKVSMRVAYRPASGTASSALVSVTAKA